MGTNLMRALLLTSASVAIVATAAPTAAYAQEATYQLDIPAQSMGDALRALGKATKQNIVFNGSLVKGKRSAAVRGRMSASEALDRMLQGSGLKMSRGAGGGLVVAQGGNADAAPARVEGSARGLDKVAAPSATASTVVDARTGVALKGALVEILETGEKTSTGDLGEFRFPGKNGSYSLRISYLGYPQYEQFVDLKDGRATAGILLSDGSITNEIVVYGSRSARAQALNQERTADNSSSVVSADDLGNFSGTTISDSLRRIGGVSFKRGTNGDGVNVIVRGIDSDLNEVKLNGVALPETTGTGRSASLNNILTDSIEQVIIHKTLLPNQDSAGTGGLVEIQTKSPLSRPDMYAQLSVEAGHRGSGYSDDYLVSGTISKKFGREKNFGVSLSVQRRNEKRNTSQFSQALLYGKYFPLEVDGTASINSINKIDPRRNFPFEEGSDQTYVTFLDFSSSDLSTKNTTVTLSAEANVSASTNIKIDYQKAVVSTSIYSSSSQIISGSYYDLTPIQSLGGQVRQGLIWDGSLFTSQAYSDLTGMRDTTEILTIRGETTSDRIQLKYSAGLANGRNRNGDANRLDFTNYGDPYIPPEFLLPQATDPIEGRVLTPFGQLNGNGIQLPLLTSAGYDFLNNPAQYGLSSAQLSSGGIGSTRRLTASGSVLYSPNTPWIDHLEFGLDYKDSKFNNDGANAILFFGDATASALGLAFDQPIHNRVGGGESYRGADRTSVINLLANLSQIAAESGGQIAQIEFPIDPRIADADSRERQYVAYLQSKLKFGRIEIVGGIRVDRTDFSANVLRNAMYTGPNSQPDLDFQRANSLIERVSGSVTSLLPRVTANWRPRENSVVRLGYYSTVARPIVGDLAAGNSISLLAAPFYGPENNQPLLSISAGNPDLRPARTHNFDLSLEHYDGNIGTIKLGLFLKTIKNPLSRVFVSGSDNLNGITLPDDPRFQNLPANTFILVTRPENGTGSDGLWGMEASLERQLTFLPGVLNGFGVFANYTYTRGSADKKVSWSAPVLDETGMVVSRRTEVVEFKNLPLQNQPRHSGTAALTYNKFGIDAVVAYSYQAALNQGFQGRGITSARKAYQTLDARFEYRFGNGGYRAFVEGNDLLRNSSDPDNLTVSGNSPGYPLIGSYLGGREIRAGFSITF